MEIFESYLLKLDLTNAIIEKDVIIDAKAIFGGVELIIPKNIKTKFNITISGIEDKRKNKEEDFNTPTIYITGFSAFGSVEIK
jgi:predicted membrane protein